MWAIIRCCDAEIKLQDYTSADDLRVAIFCAVEQFKTGYKGWFEVRPCLVTDMAEVLIRDSNGKIHIHRCELEKVKEMVIK